MQVLIAEYGDCQDLPHAPMPMQCYVHVKSQFWGKKNRFFHWEISVSYTTREYYNGYSALLSNFLSIIC